MVAPFLWMEFKKNSWERERGEEERGPSGEEMAAQSYCRACREGAKALMAGWEIDRDIERQFNFYCWGERCEPTSYPTIFNSLFSYSISFFFLTKCEQDISFFFLEFLPLGFHTIVYVYIYALINQVY